MNGTMKSQQSTHIMDGRSTSVRYPILAVVLLAGVQCKDNTGPETPPSAPSELVATPTWGSDAQMDLRWRDNSSNEEGFRIERSAGAVGFVGPEVALVGPNVTTRRDVGLVAGASYSYRVQAYNKAGASDHSDAVTATTLTPPAAPSELTATPVSATRVDLTWNDNSDNEEGFRIERASDSLSFVEIATVGLGVTIYRDEGVSMGGTYGYRVRSFNVAGLSEFSNSVMATTPSIPAAPSDLSASFVSSTEVTMEWTDNSGNEDGFRIERCGPGDPAGCTTGTPTYSEIAVVGPNVTIFRDTGLTELAYSYLVRAYNALGTSHYDHGSAVLTTPERPSGLVFTLSDTAVTLHWRDNSSAEDGFRILRDVDGGSSFEIGNVEANETTYTDRDVPAANLFVAYFVVSHNAAGSQSERLVLWRLPHGPSFTATLVSDGEVVLNWGAEVNTGQFQLGSLQGVRIERSGGGSSFAEIAVVENATTYRDTQVAAGTSYSYRVRAYNPLGTSAYSPYLVPAARVTIPPAPPFAVALSLCGGRHTSGECFVDGSVLSLDLIDSIRTVGHLDFRAIARANQGFSALYAGLFGSGDGGGGFRLDDPFLGPGQLGQELVTAEPSIISLCRNDPFCGTTPDQIFAVEGALFTPDTMINQTWCMAIGSLSPECQVNDYVETDVNDIDLSIIVRDRDGNVVPDSGTLVIGETWSSEFRVAASKGLRAIYLGVADEHCNVGGYCSFRAKLFTRFGNTYTPGTTMVIDRPLSCGPAPHRIVFELRADDGANIVAKRLHLFVESSNVGACY